jgi:hypothetical protein
MSDAICTCMQYHPLELLAMWRRRAGPIMKRLLLHGHGVDAINTGETVKLLMLIERGGPEVTSPENRHRSHHLKNCPVSIRATGRIDTVSPGVPCHAQR